MRRGELSASSSAVQTSVLDAIRFFENRRFVFNEFKDTLKTGAASATYVTLSVAGISRILLLDSIKAIIGQRDYPLKHTTWHEIESIDSGQWFGYPEYWAIHSNEIRLYPPPNDSYVYRLSGLQRLSDISAGASAQATNAWMTEGEPLIRLRAKATLFRDHLRNLPLYREFNQFAGEVYREMNRETVAKVASGKVLSTFF